LKRSDNKLSEREIEILLGMARNILSVKRTADSLFFATNSVIYHANRIKMKTGLDPTDFYDMVELLKMAKEQSDDGSAG
jgi:sugar diacid utilization regulator